MTTTRETIALALREKLGFTVKESHAAVQAVLDIMSREMKAGEEVKIKNFGKFFLQEKDRRMGRDPSSGEPKMLRARRVLRFKCAPHLREHINR